ncbi:hypothetical protein B0H14DRAFT_2592537 [Mycena olivaceomarginata]|nr:hypothetical protein B0H14DRAFT_2592537 [Mycena olivaceomarginata]
MPEAWNLAGNVGLGSVSDSAYSSITRWTSSSELEKSEAIMNVAVLELRRFRGGDARTLPDSAIPRPSCPECQLGAAEDRKKRRTFILLIMMDGNVIKVPGDGEKIEVGRKAGEGQNLGSGC